MQIKEVNLKKFRNYEEEKILFDKNINIIYGDNAQGKTNILEAIFICSLGKSFRTNKDKEIIKIGNEQTLIEVKAENSDREKKIRLELRDKKSFFINDVFMKKTSDVIGNIYIVLFTPEDISILKNEPSKRRRFLNIMISQLRPIYLHTLNKYNKALEQRNAYIKQIKYEQKPEEFLEVYDEQISELGKRIYEYRKEFIEKLNIKIKEIQYKITEKKEEIDIKYKSNIGDNYLEKLRKTRREDIQKGYTTVGIHRDDFEIFINKKEVSIYASQGQRRTTIISLKLAESEIIAEEVGERPIILLDDFMSELDKKRIKGLLENIKENQVIITCTDSFKINNSEYSLYKVTNGHVEKI